LLSAGCLLLAAGWLPPACWLAAGCLLVDRWLPESCCLPPALGHGGPNQIFNQPSGAFVFLKMRVKRSSGPFAFRKNGRQTVRWTVCLSKPERQTVRWTVCFSKRFFKMSKRLFWDLEMQRRKKNGLKRLFKDSLKTLLGFRNATPKKKDSLKTLSNGHVANGHFANGPLTVCCSSLEQQTVHLTVCCSGFEKQTVHMTVCRPFFRTANCPLLGFQNKCGLKLRTLMCGRRLRHCQPRLNNQTMGFCSASRFPLVLLRTVPFPLSEFLVSSVLLLSLCWRGSARPPVLSLPPSPPPHRPHPANPRNQSLRFCSSPQELEP